MYKIRKITFHNHPILGNLFLDFCNPEGKSVDTVILAGENGTGKSTILNAIYTVVSQVADFEADVEYETNDTVFVSQGTCSSKTGISSNSITSQF